MSLRNPSLPPPFPPLRFAVGEMDSGSTSDGQGLHHSPTKTYKASVSPSLIALFQPLFWRWLMAWPWPLSQQKFWNSQPLWKNYVVGHFIGDPPHTGKVHSSHVFPGWNYEYHRLSRIWIFWSDSVTVTSLYKIPQIIIVSISSSSGEQFLCSCVMGRY